MARKPKASVSLSGSKRTFTKLKIFFVLILMLLAFLGGMITGRNSDIAIPDSLSRAEQLIIKYCKIPFLSSGSKGLPEGKSFKGKTFDAIVVKVYDGDTITVVDDNDEKYKIRFWGIDAPEMSQTGGEDAKAYLTELIHNRRVNIEVKNVDRYSRSVAVITYGDMQVNGEMVEAGYAWWYKQYAPKADDIAEKEREARRYRRGIWQADNPTPPWEFRRSKR